ncbi:hypothetical protein CR513_52363, partial [Mucuna pruriens]
MLSKLTTAKTSQHQIVHKMVKSPAINESEVLSTGTDYLKNGNTPKDKDKDEATKVRKRASRYLDTKEHYRRRFFVPLLKCLTKS